MSEVMIDLMEILIKAGEVPEGISLEAMSKYLEDMKVEDVDKLMDRYAKANS